MMFMKSNRGDIEYLRDLKKQEIIKASIQWFLVIAIFIVGFITTETKLNLMTLVAVLGCLPASKTLVGVIVKFRYKPMRLEICEEILEKGSNLSVAFNPILTSSERIMGIDCLVISGHTICGYVTNPKTEIGFATNYIRTILEQNNIQRVNVKLLNEYVPFLSRVEGLNNMAAIDGNRNKEEEENIRHTILLYSM